MRALVVYCHPREGSFTSAVRDLVLEKLAARGSEVRVTDLYAGSFDPILSVKELEGYETCPDNCASVEADVADLRWCDTLIFIYPTWWYGLPAILKGWLDRVFLPDVAIFDADARAQYNSPRPSAYRSPGCLHNMRRKLVADHIYWRSGQAHYPAWYRRALWQTA